MVRGLYEAALGMNTAMKKLDVVSNNIANVDTVGFKKDAVVTQSFSDELMKRLGDPALNELRPNTAIGKMQLGLTVDNVVTKFTTGAFKVTNNDFDTCVDGDGFYSVQVTDPSGNVSTKYTRDGLFTTANDVLVSNDGNPILGQNGIIRIPPSAKMTIDEYGNVYADSDLVDQLQMTSFTDNATLRKYGDNLYNTTDDSVKSNFAGKVRQGMTEASNVNSVNEMVDMIVVNRWYEANQRVVTTIDSTLDKSVNVVGAQR
ncbi:flagellar basal-body rod protein FlgF [Clostridia bacterium]|nr:flagellar basal-body rod protein FlgF [Clostridia bacterium]